MFQPESGVPGWEDVPVALCLLWEPAQPGAVMGYWEILLTREAILLHQLAKSLGDWCRGRGTGVLLPSLHSSH